MILCLDMNESQCIFSWKGGDRCLVVSWVLLGSWLLPTVQAPLVVSTPHKRKRDEFAVVAQLVERLPCKQGVEGSNPSVSTKARR